MTLYKEEEYMGKTLVGIAGKTAVDQEKLGVIYAKKKLMLYLSNNSCYFE